MRLHTNTFESYTNTTEYKQLYIRQFTDNFIVELNLVTYFVFTTHYLEYSNLNKYSIILLLNLFSPISVQFCAIACFFHHNFGKYIEA